MSAEEIAKAKRLIAEMRLPDDERRTRRFLADPHGRRIDPRRTFRRSLRGGGAVIDLAYRSPATRHPPLVALVDISGSMAEYSRLFLHFLHAVAEKRRRVHSFVFATRLTNISRELASRDPDEALAQASAAGAGLGGRHAHRACAARVQPPLVAPRARAGRGGAPLHRRARAPGRARPHLRDGPPQALLPAARLAQPAPALRRLRAARAGHPHHAAARARFPPDPQPRLDGGSLRGARRRRRGSATCGAGCAGRPRPADPPHAESAREAAGDGSRWAAPCRSSIDRRHPDAGRGLFDGASTAAGREMDSGQGRISTSPANVAFSKSEISASTSTAHRPGTGRARPSTAQVPSAARVGAALDRLKPRRLVREPDRHLLRFHRSARSR